MICYKCGCSLSEHDFCTNCGADVTLYKKIIGASNYFYNDGLAKANIRDLSGAIASLRQCLKLNKNHVEARNLLGLIYFETGEVVAALSEWVISTNLRPKKNIAEDYINMIQDNQARLDTINATIKRYNQALASCQQDGLDIAVIQLKKVLSLNPKFVRAHQLLALLYINAEEWEKAQKELLKCKQIDHNNTLTLLYLKEVEAVLQPVEGIKTNGKRKKESDVVKYQSGNETIIQPINNKESRGASTLINLGVGLLIGIAACWYLMVPAKISNAEARAEEQIKVIGEQLDAKSATLNDLEQQLKSVEAERQMLSDELQVYQSTDGQLVATDYLMQAVYQYMLNAEDIEGIALPLESVTPEDVETLSEPGKDLYSTLLELTSEQMAAMYYEDGYTAYSTGEYPVAIDKLTRAVQYDESDVKALYTLAQSYDKNGDAENARKIYSEVIDTFPGTGEAKKSETFLAQLQGGEMD